MSHPVLLTLEEVLGCDALLSRHKRAKWSRKAHESCRLPDPHPDWTLMLAHEFDSLDDVADLGAQEAILQDLRPRPYLVFAHAQFVDKAPLRFRKAIRTYQRGNFQAVVSGRDTQTAIDLRDAMYAAPRSKHDMVLFRGQGSRVPWDDGQKTRVTTRLLSTSHVARSAMGFGALDDPVLIVYHVAKGTPVLVMPPFTSSTGDEQETLLPPGLRMTLRSVRQQTLPIYSFKKWTVVHVNVSLP